MKLPVFATAKLKLYAIAFAVLVLLMIVIGIGSYFAGKRDQKDAQAANDIELLAASLKQATKSLRTQQEGMAEALRLNTEAQNRMSAIAERVFTQQQQQEQFSHEIRNALELALSARPDLTNVRVGADILCAWNTANAGANSSRSAGAHASAAIPGCKPASALPKPAAGAKRLPRQLAPKPAGSS